MSDDHQENQPIFKKNQIIDCDAQSWLVLKVTSKWVKLKPLLDNGMGNKNRRVDIVCAEYYIEEHNWVIRK